jgi:hypothetical protein
MTTRTIMVPCDFCGTEGRIYVSDGGPDERDAGPCPECKGACEVEAEAEPVMLAECDCCGQLRGLSRCWAHGIETFACEDCQS